MYVDRIEALAVGLEQRPGTPGDPDVTQEVLKNPPGEVNRNQPHQPGQAMPASDVRNRQCYGHLPEQRKVDIGHEDDFFAAVRKVLCQLKGNKLGTAGLPAGGQYPPADNENPQETPSAGHVQPGEPPLAAPGSNPLSDPLVQVGIYAWKPRPTPANLAATSAK
jgi:hypothetical protein